MKSLKSLQLKMNVENWFMIKVDWWKKSTDRKLVHNESQLTKEVDWWRKETKICLMKKGVKNLPEQIQSFSKLDNMSLIKVNQWLFEPKQWT